MSNNCTQFIENNQEIYKNVFFQVNIFDENVLIFDTTVGTLIVGTKVCQLARGDSLECSGVFLRPA